MTRLRTILAVLLTAVALTSATAGSAWALSLEEAKAQGYLGERVDGLLGAVGGSVPQDAVALMRTINDQRLTKYREIAQQNGTPVTAVQKIAGQKLIDKAPAGTWGNPGSGWVRK